MIEEKPVTLDRSLDEGRIREALSALFPWPRRNPEVLLHGDYWPGNLVWSDGSLAGVIDWEEAERGDPLADLAVARLDVLWAYGPEAMEEFTAEYAALTSFDHSTLAHWDLLVTLRPMSNLARWASAYAGPPVNRPDLDEVSLRSGHRWFAAQALERLQR